MYELISGECFSPSSRTFETKSCSLPCTIHRWIFFHFHIVNSQIQRLDWVLPDLRCLWNTCGRNTWSGCGLCVEVCTLLLSEEIFHFFRMSNQSAPSPSHRLSRAKSALCQPYSIDNEVEQMIVRVPMCKEDILYKFFGEPEQVGCGQLNNTVFVNWQIVAQYVSGIRQ